MLLSHQLYLGLVIVSPVVPWSGDTVGVFLLLFSFLPLVVFAGGASSLPLATEATTPFPFWWHFGKLHCDLIYVFTISLDT